MVSDLNFNCVIFSSQYVRSYNTSALPEPPLHTKDQIIIIYFKYFKSSYIRKSIVFITSIKFIQNIF